MAEEVNSKSFETEANHSESMSQCRNYNLPQRNDITAAVKLHGSFDHPTIINDETEEELSDSNNSVFSSGSSIDSILNYNGQEHSLNDDVESFDLRDIYLGGSCALRTTWRKEVIPLFDKENITCHMPQLHESLLQQQNGELDDVLSTSPSTSHDPTTKPLENSSSNDSGIGSVASRSVYRFHSHHTIATRRLFNPSLLESSRVLLFVISNQTRSLAPMTLAAHYIGLGYNIVLCVQMLEDGCTIGRDKLTKAAVKDYNRGRAYLIDLAKRQEVPVFSELKQAVECAIEKVKQCKSHNST